MGNYDGGTTEITAKMEGKTHELDPSCPDERWWRSLLEKATSALAVLEATHQGSLALERRRDLPFHCLVLKITRGIYLRKAI